MGATEREKELYKKLTPIMGIKPVVQRYYDENEENSIFIISCPDPTDDDVVFYATLGLSFYNTARGRQEIMAAGYKRYTGVGNVLSTSAFFCIKDDWQPRQGVVFETLAGWYFKHTAMQHLYFTAPYIWEDKLEGFTVEGEPVEFLLAIPISDAELDYLNKNGPDALETLLQDSNADIFDYERKSVI